MKHFFIILAVTCAAWGQNPISSHPRLLINDQIPDTWDPADYPGGGTNGRLKAISDRIISGAAASDFGSLQAYGIEYGFLCPDRTGTVNTNGTTTITWASGDGFGCAGGYAPANIIVAGVSYGLVTYGESGGQFGTLTTTTPVPTATGATFTWQYDWSGGGVFGNTSQYQALPVDTLNYTVAYQAYLRAGNTAQANEYANSIWRAWAQNPSAVTATSIVVSGGVATVTLSAAPVPALVNGGAMGIWGASDDLLCGAHYPITVIDSTHFSYVTGEPNGTHTDSTLIVSAFWQGAQSNGQTGAQLSAWAYLYDHCHPWLVANGYDQRARNELKAGYWSITLTRGSSQFNNNVRESDFHNYTSWELAGIMEAGLALYGDDPFGATILAEGMGYYWTGQRVVPYAGAPTESFEYNLKKSVDQLTGGAFNWEGAGYIRNGQITNLRAIEAYDSATARANNIWGTQFSTAKNAGLYEIYAQMPDGCKADLGDAGSTQGYAGRDTLLLSIVNDRFPDPHFVWMMSSYAAPGANGSQCGDGAGDWATGASGGPDGLSMKFIFYPYVKGPGSHDLTDLPLAAQFGADTFFRTGWTSTDTVATYSTSIRGTYHRHEDAGTILLYRNAPLILGQPYTLASPTYANYNRRTIGGNTLTIYDSSDCWKDHASTCGINSDSSYIVNDGGQLTSARRFLPQFANVEEYEIHRLWSGSTYTDTTGYNGSTYAAIFSANDPKGLASFVAGTGYEHLYSDLTPMYVHAGTSWDGGAVNGGEPDNPNVKVSSSHGVVRQLIHFQPTRGSLNPIIVFDSVNSTNSSLIKSWLLHLPNAPTVTYGGGTVTPGPGDNPYTAATLTKEDNLTGRLYVQHLLPTTPSVRVVGGDATTGATTLNGDITSGQTSISVMNGSGISNGEYELVDSELMQVTAGGGTNSQTVSRGVVGYAASATSHSSGAAVQPWALASVWAYYVDQYGPSGSGGAHLWDPSMHRSVAAYQPNWTIMERPSTSETQDYFLNVLTPTTTSVGSAPTTTLISGTGLYGAMVADSGGYYVGIFGTNLAGVSSLSYTATHSGTAQHVVKGLSTGTATITQGGTTVATATVDAAGGVGFSESGGGAFQITVQGNPSGPSVTGVSGRPSISGNNIVIH
jgi:hypothetical protein